MEARLVRIRRSREAIILEILCICAQDQNITRIVYQANTNYATVKAYLDLLVHKELVEVIDQSGLSYRTSEKGRALRDRLCSIEEALDGL